MATQNDRKRQPCRHFFQEFIFISYYISIYYIFLYIKIIIKRQLSLKKIQNFKGIKIYTEKTTLSLCRFVVWLIISELQGFLSLNDVVFVVLLITR